jgi:chemotaxis protein MotB
MVGKTNGIRAVAISAALAIIAVSFIGCGNGEELRLKDEEIASLQSKVSTLESDLADEKARAQKVHADLEGELSSVKNKNSILLDSLGNMSIITIDDAALFGLSSTHLTDYGTDILDRIAGVIKGNPGRQVWIEGHTDNVQIGMEYRGTFASNWEMSSARAHSALHYLLKKHDLDPQLVAAVGYGEHRPIADNESEEGRSRNRRVVITIGPKYMKTVSQSAGQ